MQNTTTWQLRLVYRKQKVKSRNYPNSRCTVSQHLKLKTFPLKHLKKHERQHKHNDEGDKNKHAPVVAEHVSSWSRAGQLCWEGHVCHLDNGPADVHGGGE